MNLPGKLQKSPFIVNSGNRLYYILPGKSPEYIDIENKIIKDPKGRIIAKNSINVPGVTSEPSDEFWKERFRPIFVKTIRTKTGLRHFISIRNGGLIYSDDNLKTFNRVYELPKRFVPEDYSGPVLFRDVEDLWQNPFKPEHLLAINKLDILQSRNGGKSFQKCPIREFIVIIHRLPALQIKMESWMKYAWNIGKRYLQDLVV